MLSFPFSRNEAATWIVFSGFAAYTGPFGTYSLSLGWRLIYWTLVVVISAAMATIFLRLVRDLIGPGRRVVRDLLTAGLMTVFFTPVLIWLSRYFMADEFNGFTDAFYFGQYVAIITLGVVSGRRALFRIVRGPRSDRLSEPLPDPRTDRRAPEAVPDAGLPPEPAPAPDPEAKPEPRLMRRLPPEATGPVLRLTSEDHFVDVVTPDGAHRLRMRLADAIDEMEPVEGISTHRSHWVARAAIDGVERDGSRVLLRLSNGDLVPVSRTYRPRLEEAGLL